MTADAGQIVLVLALIAAFVLAAVTGSWWTVLVAPAISLLYFLGLDAGWWGTYIFREGWVFAFAQEVLFGIGAVSLGIALRWVVVRTLNRKARA